MKCPRCGKEMVMDSHRKYGLQMCYECGYMEGRNMGEDLSRKTSNFERLRSMNENEAIPFIAAAFNVNSADVSAWLNRR